MGRKSKLTDEQWGEIEKRLLAEEPARALAREYKVSEAAIRARKSAHVKEIKAVANQIVETHAALKALPISAQVSAHNLADELISISQNLAGAARYGAMTAHRLSGLAHTQTDKVDEVDPLKTLDVLRGVATLTKMANESSEIGINLLRANKETIDDINKRKESESAPAGLTHFYGGDT